MKWLIPVVIALFIAGCSTEKPVDKILPLAPAPVTAVKVNWKVVAEVRDIEGKPYLVMPYDGNPYVALSYTDSLVLRSWLNDVKRKNDQTENVLCAVGYKEKCKTLKKLK